MCVRHTIRRHAGCYAGSSSSLYKKHGNGRLSITIPSSSRCFKTVTLEVFLKPSSSRCISTRHPRSILSRISSSVLQSPLRFPPKHRGNDECCHPRGVFLPVILEVFYRGANQTAVWCYERRSSATPFLVLSTVVCAEIPAKTPRE